MFATMFSLFSGGLVALAAAAIAYGIWRNRQRRQAWQQAAHALGLTYFDKRNDVLAHFDHFQWLKSGDSRKIVQGLRGDAGDTQIIIADFQYTTSSGENSSTTTASVCIVTTAALHAPHAFLRPKMKVFDFLGKVFGAKSVDLAEDPAFSNAYTLKGEDEEALRRLFGPELRAWFMERRQPLPTFECRQQSFMFTLGKMDPATCKTAIGAALDLLRRLGSKEEADRAE